MTNSNEIILLYLIPEIIYRIKYLQKLFFVFNRLLRLARDAAIHMNTSQTSVYEEIIIKVVFL